MTKEQEKNLDILYQNTLKEKYPESILTGCTDLIHHFLQGRYNSIRWYTPMGIPLTIEQHNEIHGKNGDKLKKIIIAIKGIAWHNDLIRQKNKVAKNLDYNKVKSHILGEIDNYV